MTDIIDFYLIRSMRQAYLVPGGLHNPWDSEQRL